ncbi:hypothetical protein GCM10023085_45720 [Actinomadura viridis]
MSSDRTVALHICTPDGAGMTTLTDNVPAPVATRIYNQVVELGLAPGDDRRRVILIVPRPGKDPRILGRSVPLASVRELEKLLDGEA